MGLYSAEMPKHETELRSSKRIGGFDLARALAICAMILENFKVLMLADQQEPHLLVWGAGLTDGRSAPLFVLLAGVGLSLFSRGARESEDPKHLGAARKVLLLRALFFLALSDLFIRVWEMDILHFFAAYFAIAAVLFLRATRRQLLWASAGVVLLSTTVLIWRGEAYFDDSDYSTLPGMLSNTFIDGIHPVMPWLAYFILGMWLGRLDLRRPALRQRVLWGALAVAVGTELASVGLNYLSVSGIADLTPAAFPHLYTTRLSPPGPLYVISASATSIVAIALCHMICERRPNNIVVRTLVSAGQLSLTLYLAHAIVGAGLLYALGELEEHSIWFLLAYWLGYFVISVSLAAWWRSRSPRGPLEWVMRAVSGSGPKIARAPAAVHESPSSTTEAEPRSASTVVAAVLVGLSIVVYVQLFGFAPPSTSCNEARRLERGSPQTAQLGAICREHWYLLTLDRRESVTIDIDSCADSYLEVLDEEGEELVAEDDDSGPGYNPSLTTDLAAGTYRLRLRPYRSGTGPYSIEAR